MKEIFWFSFIFSFIISILFIKLRDKMLSLDKYFTLLTVNALIYTGLTWFSARILPDYTSDVVVQASIGLLGGWIIARNFQFALKTQYSVILTALPTTLWYQWAF